ncbi:reverse transcriptase domain-containing protein [Tanacetum coccineum]
MTFITYVQKVMMRDENMQNQNQNLPNQNDQFNDMLTKFMEFPNTASLQLPKTSTSVIQESTPSTNSEPVVAPVSASMPNLKRQFVPSRRNDERRREKANDQIEKFDEIFKDLSFEISLTDALILMPKFASTLKALIGNKENVSEMARTPLNEHCLAVILNKLPKKLGDPGKFLIPLCKKLSLSELTPTCMTLELADRSITQLIGITEDIDVKVGKFQFPADFVVVDFDADPRVPLILGRSFLKTGRALIDVYEELKVCEAKNDKSSIDEPPEVELKDSPPHLEYAFLEGDNKLPVIIAKDLSVEEKAALIKVLKSHKLSHTLGNSPTLKAKKLLTSSQLAIVDPPGEITALKHANFDLETAGDHRKVQLNELNELRDHAYENSLIYKEKTKRIHDSKIKNRVFNVGDQVLLFNSRLKMFSGKLKSRWSGPFTIAHVFPYGTVELSQNSGPNFKVNGHRIKHYFGGDIPKLVVPDLQTFPKDK